jgi:hypothetical protein
LIFAQNLDPPSIHISKEHLLSVPKRLCRYMMIEFRSPKGMYQQQPGHMADNDALCNWANIGQEQLRIVHDAFLRYLNYS